MRSSDVIILSCLHIDIRHNTTVGLPTCSDVTGEYDYPRRTIEKHIRRPQSTTAPLCTQDPDVVAMPG